MGKGTLEKDGRSIRFKAKFNPPNNPTPTPTSSIQDIQDESDLSTPVENQEPIDNYSKSVTFVTDAQSNQSQQLEPSPPIDVSPVTSTNAPEKVEAENSEIKTNTSKHENIRWLLQLLSDLEFAPAPHPRFTNFEQLKNLLNELEQRAKDCYDELLEKCPDYLERIIIALETVSGCFYSSSLEPEVAATISEDIARFVTAMPKGKGGS